MRKAINTPSQVARFPLEKKKKSKIKVRNSSQGNNLPDCTFADRNKCTDQTRFVFPGVIHPQTHRRSSRCTKTAETWRQPPHSSNHRCMFFFFFWTGAAAQSEPFSTDCSKLHALLSVSFHATLEAPGSGADVRTCELVAGFVGAPEPAGTGGDSKWQEQRLTGRRHDWRLTHSGLEFYYKELALRLNNSLTALTKNYK